MIQMKTVSGVSHPVGEPKPFPDFLLAMEGNRILLEQNEKLQRVAEAAREYVDAPTLSKSWAYSNLLDALEKAEF
jgi:hypothetical protein